MLFEERPQSLERIGAIEAPILILEALVVIADFEVQLVAEARLLRVGNRVANLRLVNVEARDLSSSGSGSVVGDPPPPAANVQQPAARSTRRQPKRFEQPLL
eukprot:COSAG06_NODE_2178_length_7407_cov_8.831554_2_plen_102_part_00